MPFAFEKNVNEYVIAALFDSADEPVAVLGDGRVVFPDAGAEFAAHPNAGALSAVIHPSGVGVVTGGDDGRVVWTTKESGPIELFAVKGAWFDVVTASDTAMLIAASAGKKAYVYDVNKKTSVVFEHSSSLSDIAFDAKGRKLYAATYNGVVVWFSRIAQQKPVMLKWAGSHTKIAVSPDDRFVMTAMQENALHGWRIADAKDMRMGGYPAKIKSIGFFAKGKLLATSGANGAVVWPFLRANGPMGEEASEINAEESTMVSVVAGAPEDTLLAAGLEDGRVWLAELTSTGIEWIRREKGASITALAISGEANRLIFGDEDGNLWVYEAE